MTTTARPAYILVAILAVLPLAAPAVAGTTGSNETITVAGGRTETAATEDKTYVLTSVSHPATNAEPPTEEVQFVFHQIK